MEHKIDEYGRFTHISQFKAMYRNPRRETAKHLRMMRRMDRKRANRFYRDAIRMGEWNYPAPIPGHLTPCLIRLVALFQGKLLSEWPNNPATAPNSLSGEHSPATT